MRKIFGGKTLSPQSSQAFPLSLKNPEVENPVYKDFGLWLHINLEVPTKHFFFFFFLTKL